MKIFLVLTFLLVVQCIHAQINDVKKIEADMLTAFMKRDSQTIKKWVDDDFILVQADGVVQNKSDFVNTYNVFRPEDSFRISTRHEKLIGKNDLVIINGIVLNQ